MDTGMVFLSYETPPGPDGRKIDQFSAINEEPIYSTCKSLDRRTPSIKIHENNIKTPKRESWDFILESKNIMDLADVTNNFGSLDYSGIDRFCKNEKVRLCESSSRKGEPDFSVDYLEKRENFNDDCGTISTVSEFILIKICLCIWGKDVPGTGTSTGAT
uniref:Uncharacterized protein n=1 Tax=Romanomermis culicivorax TaxID=13658 RepID=A0A915HU77_ROMCU